MPEKTQKKKHGFDAFFLSFFTFASRILGFIRVSVIASLFGASGDADIINALFSLPSTIRRLLSEGSFSAVFIPELVSAPSDTEFQKRMHNIITIHWIIVGSCCILGFLFSKQIVHLLFYFPDELQMQKAVSLFRWFFIYLLFLVLPAVCLVVLHIKGKFIPGAIAPMFFSGVVICILLVFTAQFGIVAFVTGVILGGFVQFMVHYIPFHRLGYRLIPSFQTNWRYNGQLLKKWGMLSITTFAGVITQQIAIAIASSLSTGSVSSLAYSLVFYQLPIGIFAYSILTVFFPNVATAHHEKDSAKVRFIVLWAFVQLWILLIPSMVYLYYYSVDIISLIIGYGKFSSDAITKTALLLQYYALSLFPASVYILFIRYFTAQKKFKTLIRISTAFVVVDVLLSLILVRTTLEVVGLPAAFLITNILCACILGLCYLREQRHTKLEKRGVLNKFIQSILAILVGSGVSFALQKFSEWQFPDPSRLLEIVILVINGIFFSGLTLFVYRLFRIPILKFPAYPPMD